MFSLPLSQHMYFREAVHDVFPSEKRQEAHARLALFHEVIQRTIQLLRSFRVQRKHRNDLANHRALILAHWKASGDKQKIERFESLTTHAGSKQQAHAHAEPDFESAASPRHSMLQSRLVSPTRKAVPVSVLSHQQLQLSADTKSANSNSRDAFAASDSGVSTFSVLHAQVDGLEDLEGQPLCFSVRPAPSLMDEAQPADSDVVLPRLRPAALPASIAAAMS